MRAMRLQGLTASGHPVSKRSPQHPHQPLPDRQQPGVDEEARRRYRNTLGQFATGVAVITARNDQGEPVGVTCNSFTSVSLDPPLILWSVAHSSASAAAFREGRSFAVNILAAEQEEIALRFARSGSDKFAGLAWHEGVDGAPLLEECVAYMECHVDARYPGGDHVIIVGAVQHYVNMERDPLLFHSGEFRRFT